MTNTPLPPTDREPDYRLTGPNLPTTVGLARHWMADLLRRCGWPQFVDRAVLCTSELVTNAHLHTASDAITVAVSLSAEGVTVCVYDDAPERAPRPHPAWADPHALRTTGRGLGLLSAYADTWEPHASGTAKGVRFRLLAPQSSGPAD